MYQSRIRSAGEYDAAAIHPMVCPCPECAAHSDPIGHARDRRVVRAQGFALGLLALTLYAIVAWSAPGIANAFGWSVSNGAAAFAGGL